MSLVGMIKSHVSESLHLMGAVHTGWRAHVMCPCRPHYEAGAGEGMPSPRSGSAEAGP